MKLLATAIDQSVSPGATMCGWCAEAGAAAATATSATATEAACLRFIFHVLSCEIWRASRFPPATPSGEVVI